MERRTGHYVLSIGLNLACIAGTAAAMVAVGPSWWQLAFALPAAVFAARTCFLGHDAGHQQIARDHKTNRRLGLLHGNLLLGMSYGWWTTKHNRHHANPNHVAKDPDVGVGALAWTEEHARSRRHRVTRWLTRNQAALFFPMLLLEGFNLKISSIRDVRNRTTSEQRLEVTLLAVHLVAYVGFLLLVMSPLQALAFVVLHHALLGVHLGSAFAPNHKGMPMPQPGQR
ncbi:MAG: fatty acid desaturase family protein, partial [Nocardioidaceae bacterium]